MDKDLFWECFEMLKLVCAAGLKVLSDTQPRVSHHLRLLLTPILQCQSNEGNITLPKIDHYE